MIRTEPLRARGCPPSPDAERVFWQVVRRALLQVIRAIEARWGASEEVIVE